MPHINTYLTFDGKTEEAFNFYRAAIGGEFSNFQRFGDAPSDQQLPESEAKRIMHVALPVGKNAVLMGSDTSPHYGHQVTTGNNFSISVTADSKEEAKSIFDALSAGGNITMPLADTFWGAYFGMFTDKFGINWMVNYDYPKS
jgi:PhnB protein